MALLLAAVQFSRSISVVPAFAEAMKPMLFPLATLSLAATWLKLEANTPKEPFMLNWELLMLTVVRAVDVIAIPLPALLLLLVPLTKTLPPALVMLIPLPVKPKMLQFSTIRALPLLNCIPLIPLLIPLILMFRRMTTSVLALAWTTIPLVPLTRVEATWPPPPSRVMALVMVTAPNPPGSTASFSPQGAVLELAPAHAWHGAVRLHGMPPWPTPGPHCRLACALIKLTPTRTGPR